MSPSALRRSGSARYPVQAVERALSIIQLLADTPGSRPMGVTEIAQRLGVSKSTAHRLLTTLVDYDMVARDERGGKYRLGWGLYKIGHRLPHTTGVHVVAQPHMERVCRSLGETVNLAILSQGRMVIIDSCGVPDGLRIELPRGVPHPLHSAASAKALIIDLPEAELHQLLGPEPFEAYTARTITTFAGLKADLAEARRRGYTLDDEEGSLGVKCVGAPVRDHRGAVVAAVSVTGPCRRISGERLVEIARQVRNLALDISRRIGFTGTATI